MTDTPDFAADHSRPHAQRMAARRTAELCESAADHDPDRWIGREPVRCAYCEKTVCLDGQPMKRTKLFPGREEPAPCRGVTVQCPECKKFHDEYDEVTATVRCPKCGHGFEPAPSDFYEVGPLPRRQDGDGPRDKMINCPGCSRQIHESDLEEL